MATELFAPGSDDVLVVVDLSAQLFRAYHAIRPLSSPSGEPTHAVYGVVTILERLVKDLKPRRLAIALDSGRTNTFRAKLYPAYKANRPETPEDLVVQLHRASSIVRAFTPHVWQKEGFEADDLIATAVERARKLGLRTLIVGADKDLMQLCGDDVRLWDVSRDRVIGPPEVREKFGVAVEQLGDMLALMGDSSDNIPGVPGIGPKTAAELINAFGNLDGLYAHLDEVPKKRLRDLLREHAAQAHLSRQLVALDRDCDEAVKPECTTWSGRDEPALRAIYEELGFSRLAAALQGAPSPSAAAPRDTATAPSDAEAAAPKSPTQTSLNFALADEAIARPPTRLSSVEAIREWFAADLRGPCSIVLSRVDDTLTFSPLVAIALANSAGVVVMGATAPNIDGGDFAEETLLTEIIAALSRPGQQLYTHGSKHLYLALGDRATAALRVTFDTELASYLLDPEQPHDLDSLARRLNGASPFRGLASPYQRAARTAVSRESLEGAIVRQAELVHQLVPRLLPRLLDEGLTELLETVELPLARTLATMQRRGVLVDTSQLSVMSAAMDQELGALESKATAAASHPFNLNSPRQLETILFDELGLKPQRRTKTSRSTDAATLEALAEEHPLPRLILQHRQVAKLKSTYVDALPNLVQPNTGRIHSSWEQTVTATGRLSSTEPNLQNIPIRTELGRAIRRAFVAPPNTQLISADYSQIELRILAHLSQDPELVEAFNSGQDVHLRTAMAVFGVAESAVTNDMRRQAKAVNFGVIYGQGDSGLAVALGITRQQASDFIAAYYRRYRGVREFMNRTLEHARHGKAVSSMLGRRRYFNDIESANRALRLSAERMAMNMPIQATAADILKLAMLALAEPVTPGTRMVMTVHDELVFEVPNGEIDEAKGRIRTLMQGVAQLSVPLVVDIGVANNWADAH